MQNEEPASRAIELLRNCMPLLCDLESMLSVIVCAIFLSMLMYRITTF